jgi:hypothetical protein
MATIFTKYTNPTEVVHSIDDSHLLILNSKVFISAEFQGTLQKIELLAEQLSIVVDCFDFVVGDHDRIVEIFAGLKRQQSEVESRIDRELRPCGIIIAGTYLQDQISICALNALVVGYEVYLLNDAIEPRDVTHRETFVSELTQAGVVLSTVEQILYQWLAVETDQTRKETLTKLLSHTN